MRPIELCEGVHWVGAVDWDLRDFHGYTTEKGSSYNAYLVKAGKVALFDTVKLTAADQLISNLRVLIDPKQVDYIVLDHAEMDHTGALPELIELCQPEKVYCSPDCEKVLKAHFHRDDWPIELVKEGDALDLGGKTVRFFMAKMLHWPDSMVSYLEEDRILISNDIFGQHFATSERFDDQVDAGELAWQAAKYFVNIFNPTAAAMRKLLARLEAAEVKPAMLAPDHGVIWRAGVEQIWGRYQAWSSGETVDKAVLVYDTMWGSTASLAQAIGRGLASAGLSVKVFDLRYSHRSDIMTDVLDARAVLLGSSVLNRDILPEMAAMVTYMRGLKPQNKVGAAFGSYGWANTAVKKLNEAMTEMKFELVGDGVSVQYRPTDDDLDRAHAFGAEIGAAAKAG